MWSSKMAARWRGEDGDLNAVNGDFLAGGRPDEAFLSGGDAVGAAMDSRSCADHSILSILEDSPVASEGKSGTEEESETLLSALTEMLDSVGDDDGTMSPFDVLPDTRLLARREYSDSPAAPPKSPNVTLAVKGGGGEGDEAEAGLPQLLTQRAARAESEVEVFTSASLVNLVKLMHNYCLKLRAVEEEEADWPRRSRRLLSQGEVWRYERPADDGDEEIHVVSDDEEPAQGPAAGGGGGGGKPLKGVLLNGSSPRAPPSRGRKRVSFGPVKVASFDESAEGGLSEKPLTGETASLNGTEAFVGPAPEPRAAAAAAASDANEDKALPAKRETKAKSLSLQQYRQLRQKRQPPAAKRGNHTTKWPSVSEPPEELPPILCLQGHSQNCCGPKTARRHPDATRTSTGHLRLPGNNNLSHRAALPPSSLPSQAKLSARIRCSGLKRQRPESKSISPWNPPPDAATTSNGKAGESAKSPAKKPALLSSDPPNPVLVPLPVHQIASAPPAADSDLHSTTHLRKIQSAPSAALPQRQPPSSSEPKPNGASVNQETQNKSAGTATDVSPAPRAPRPAATRPEPTSERDKLQPHRCSPSPAEETEPEPGSPQPPGPDPAGLTERPSSTPRSAQPPSPGDAPGLVKREALSDSPSPEEPPAARQAGSGAQDATFHSGIEAPDLTSLLEQFEETQAKEERVGEIGPAPAGSNATSGSLPTPCADPLGPPSTAGSPVAPKAAGSPPRAGVPEPLGTDVVLGAQQGQPARRKNPPPKAIQIIDPRPLPSKKTHGGTSEPPAAHAVSCVYSDHDYCGPADHPPAGAAQRSRARPPFPKDVPKRADELQAAPPDSRSAAAQWRAEAMQRRPEQPGTRSETSPPTGQALRLTDAGEDKTSPYPLPTPPPSPPARGREKRRRCGRGSPRSDSSSSSRHSSCSSSSSSSSSSSRSSSASHSLKRPRLRRRRSESSSCSSSPCGSVSHSPPRRYRLSYSRSRCSRSRSRSWSQSRSRSPSPQICRRQWKDVYRSRESRRLQQEHEMRIQKLKAIDERRVVYVGRIRRSMTHDELRERFSQFGEVECVSLHFRDRGDHYGFVTFYNMEDAFAAIDNGGKLRKPDELPFDICFGGRRQFCSSNYADLDANRDAEPSPAKNRFEDLDFDSLLKQAQRGLKR